MTQVTLLLESAVAVFYTKVAEQAGLPLETVLSNALFNWQANYPWKLCNKNQNKAL